MDSFYGGKQGVSFVIKESFSSVEAMQQAFRGGGNYTDVWYGEHCLIDTPNKNDKDNGKIFRRGLDYQNRTTAGAIYIGQIVGPSSGTPYFQLNTIDEVEYQSQQSLEENSYRRYPTGYQLDAAGHVIGYETSDGSDGKPITTFPFSKAHDTSIVPGKYEENGVTKFRDEIKWTWCNIRKDNADADSWFYVGFEIPYAVIDYSIHMTSAYDEQGNVLQDATDIRRVDDQTHPFYEKWDLGLPKGIKGDTLRNLRVITPIAADKNRIYATSVINVDPATGETILGNPGYPGIEDDIAKGREIVVFDYYIYDKLLNPTPIMVYLGDFNIITNVAVANDGTLTVEYTHDDNTVFTRKIKWVTGVSLTTGNGINGGHFEMTFNNGSLPYTADLTWVKGIEIQEDGTVVYTHAGTNAGALGNTGLKTIPNLLKWVRNASLDPNTGAFQVTYNNGSPAFETTLDWIKRIELDDDGTLHFWHTKDNRDEQLTNELKWVTGVELSPSTGLFTMNFNYGDPLVRQLDWVDDIYINEDTGEIVAHHTNPAKGNITLDAKLKLITRAAASANGVVTFYTNTGDSFNIKNLNAQTDFHIKTIDNVTLNTRLADDKRINIKYNTENSSTPIGDPINFVYDMVVRSSDFHLLVLFNDPTHRAKAEDLDENGKDASGVAWVNNIPGSTGTTYDPSIYWRDYGTIKDQSGILVGFNLTRTDIGPDTDILEYLNTNFPNGLTGEQNMPGGNATKGKIVTFSEEESDDKDFYAFDYNSGSPGKWFYLGKIADSGMRDAKLVIDRATADEVKMLSTQGLLFRAVTSQKSSVAMPKYWDKAYVWSE